VTLSIAVLWLAGKTFAEAARAGAASITAVQDTPTARAAVSPLRNFAERITVSR
jgi:hypothetical protein